MGNALRKGLIGGAIGALKGMQALVEEAKTERLRQARMAEARALQLDDRKYQEERDEVKFNRDRSAKMEDEERGNETEQQRFERNREAQLEDAEANRRHQIALAEKNGAMYGTRDTQQTGRYLIEVDGQQIEVPGTELERLRAEGKQYKVITAPSGLLLDPDLRNKPRTGKEDDKPTVPPATNKFANPYEKQTNDNVFMKNGKFDPGAWRRIGEQNGVKQ